MRVFLSLLIAVFIGTSSQSAILIRAFNAADHENIDDILRTYTGPSPRYLREEKAYIPEVDSVLLNPDIPHAEIAFVKDRLSKQHIAADIAYVPSTVWNLYVTSKALADPAKYKRYSHLINRFLLEGYRGNYFGLSAELIDLLDSIAGEKDIALFQNLSIKILEDIERTEIKEDKQSREFYTREMKDSLVKELDKIRSGEPSILHKMIEEEVTANRNNQILLVRTTSGIELKMDPQAHYLVLLDAYEHCSKNLGEASCAPPQKPSDDSTNFDEYAQGEKHRKILDFPLHHKSGNAYGAIQGFHEDMIKDPLQNINSKGLSYADSFLAGLLFDGFNRAKSACSFVFYFRNPQAMVYTIPLKKQFVFSSRGRDLLYFREGSLETDGIFGAQETFHPRLRKLVLRKKNIQLKNYIAMETIYADTLVLDEFSHFIPVIEQNEIKKKIAQFILTASKILSEAHVISSPTPPEDVLSGQKEVVQALLERISTP